MLNLDSQFISFRLSYSFQTVVPVWPFCLLKEKQAIAAATDDCLLHKCTDSLALFAAAGILAEIVPSHP